MNTMPMIESADPIQIPQDGSPASKLRFSVFLPIRLDYTRLYPLALDLLATTGADQVVCSPSCRRYVVRAETQAMEEEQGVLVSLVLPDTCEPELSVKAWAIQAAKHLSAGELRFIAYEVYTISASASQVSDAFQLSFNGW